MMHIAGMDRLATQVDVNKTQKSSGEIVEPQENTGQKTSEFTSSHASSMKSQVMFGYSTDKKLTFSPKPTRIIEDPILGKIEVYKYSNGQELFAIKDDSIPLVSFGILAKTGSANEKAHMNGVSHFLEHLVFKGTDKIPGDEIKLKLESLGAGVNAHTGEDQTFFFLYDLPKESLKEAIKIQSELFQNIAVPQEGLDKERGAVVEEIQMYADNKGVSLHWALEDQVYADSSYRRTVLGPAEHIGDYMRSVLTGSVEKDPEVRANWQERLELLADTAKGLPMMDKSGEAIEEQEQKILGRLKKELRGRNLKPEQVLTMYPFNPNAEKLDDAGLRREAKVHDLTRDQILEYYNQHYAPENRAILVVGDFDTEMVLNTVAEQLNKPFEALKLTSNRKKLKPIGQKAETLIKEDMGNVVLTRLGFKGPNPSDKGVDKDLAALDALSIILGGGESSRLHQDLFEKQHLVNSVGMGFAENVKSSMLYLAAQSTADQMADVQEAFKTHLKSVIKDGVSTEELERAQAQVKMQMLGGMEDQMSKIMALESAVLNNRFERDLGQRVELINALTPADVQAAAKKYMSDTGYAVSLVPNDYGQKAKQSSEPVKFSGTVKFSGALSERDESRVLSSGTELIVQSRPENPLTAITLRINGGHQADEIPGEISLLAQVLERGTENRSVIELQNELAQYGIELSSTADLKSIDITLKGLSEKKEKMFEILADFIQNGPALRASDVDVVKQQYEQKLQMVNATNPDSVVMSGLREAMYPDSHPMGTAVPRIVANLEKMTPDGLKKTWERLFSAPNLTISMVGDVTMAEAAQEAETWTASLSKTSTVLPELKPRALTANKMKTQVYDNLDQSKIMRGWYAPGIKSEDRPAMTVLANMLSGGLTARFFVSFREKPEKALAYTVQAQYNPQGDMKFFIGTDHSNLTKVMEMFQEEVDLLIKEPATKAELDKVKLLLKSRGISASQKTNRESAYLSSHRGADVDSREEQYAKIQAVTVEDVQRMAQKYLAKPSITMVLAPEAVLEQYNLPVGGEGSFDFDESGKLVLG